MELKMKEMLSERTIIAGPCVYEGNGHAYHMAQSLKSICDDLDVKLIFKMSFDKANRTSINSYCGVGNTSQQRLQNSLHVFRYIREVYGIEVITDIHECWQADRLKNFVDVIQIPALLSRQTDLLLAAGDTGCTVNIKKGQNMAPKDIIHAVEKVRSTGNNNVFVTDRGSAYGFNDNVLDFRSILDWRRLGLKVCYDVTHPCQFPSANSGGSTGDWEYAKVFGPAAAAAGVDAIFMETHNFPERAKSDGANSVPLSEFRKLLERILEVWYKDPGYEVNKPRFPR